MSLPLSDWSICLDLVSFNVLLKDPMMTVSEVVLTHSVVLDALVTGVTGVHFPSVLSHDQSVTAV